MRKAKGLMIFSSIVSLLAFYFFNRATVLYQRLDGNILERTSAAIDNLMPSITEKIFYVSLEKASMITGLIGFSIIWLIFIYNVFGAKKYMHGVEHGSAEWGTKKDIQPYIDKNENNNIILSATESLSMNSRMSDTEYDRNKNVLVIGGSGSGKTRFFVKPNLMQLHSSYVMTDPKGTLIVETGSMFAKANYEIRALNTINFKKSMHYNPLIYIKSEKDILKLVNVIIVNTKGEGDKSGEDFWVKAEKLFYQAIIGYLYYEAPESDRNIPTLIDMLEYCEVKEDDENYKNAIDILFEELEEKGPKNFAVKQYKKFKLAAGKTLKSILISCAARLAPFDIQEVRELMSYDELQLDEIGDRKTAFYVIMSDTDNTFSFLIAMMFYQMFNLLCDKADDEYGGRLPFHVRCMLDEFANIGKIPNFEKLISTIRSREISASIVLQSQSQIQSIYKDDAETIIDCCDTLLFLGGKSTKTNKSMSEMIGKTTIDNININESKGQTGSYSMNNQVLGRDLVDPSEVGRLKRSECLIMITGEKPFRSKKYNIKKHKNYQELSDFDKKNAFDITQRESTIAEHFLGSIEEIQEVNNLSELNTLT
ncbi:MAG: type IV secretory system conjugative DNA transfer family protein [Oscillospiraceae bacterium]